MILAASLVPASRESSATMIAGTRSSQIRWLQVPAHPPERRGVAPPRVLEARRIALMASSVQVHDVVDDGGAESDVRIGVR
jgi:hypothetical protein